MKKLLCALCAMTLLATATGCSNNNADKDKRKQAAIHWLSHQTTLTQNHSQM